MTVVESWRTWRFFASIREEPEFLRTPLDNMTIYNKMRRFVHIVNEHLRSGDATMEHKKLSRRERERMTQRHEMLAAALELFSEKGYHNVSMHQIAEKAEFAIGTLYKFFNNKEDLYQALILEKFFKFHEALTRAIVEPDDELQKLRRYVQVKGEVFRANVSMIRLYFAETHGARFNVMAGFGAEIRRK